MFVHVRVRHIYDPVNPDWHVKMRCNIEDGTITRKKKTKKNVYPECRSIRTTRLVPSDLFFSTLQLSFIMEFNFQMTLWLQVQDQTDLLLVHRCHKLPRFSSSFPATYWSKTSNRGNKISNWDAYREESQSKPPDASLRSPDAFHRRTRWMKKQILFLIAEQTVWKIQICKHKTTKWSQRGFRRSRRMKFG